MSLDSESPSPSSGRDWFFPSPTFVDPNPRRFATNPRAHRPPKPSSFQNFSHSSSKYGAVRRRVDFGRRTESMLASNIVRPSSKQKPDVPAKKQEISNVAGEKKCDQASTGRFSGRWQMAISATVSLCTSMCSLEFLAVWIPRKFRKQYQPFILSELYIYLHDVLHFLI